MRFDAVICGGGAVGIALARELSFEFKNVLVIEQNSLFASETSSRNSEVIHAGLYYPTNSLKHIHCIHGRKLLYNYLKSKSIKYSKIGKLVVACDQDDQAKLAWLYNQAKINQVDGLAWLECDEIAKLEPELSCVGGFISKNTGIFDSHNFFQALVFDAEQNGVVFAKNHRFKNAEVISGLIKIVIENLEDDPIYTKRFFNCSGLYAIEVMRNCYFGDRSNKYRYEYAKGNYFSLSGPSPFQHLVYPIPEKGGLGIHSTLDCNGKTKFGPNVEWTLFDLNDLKYNYFVDPKLNVSFKDAIKRYWPQVETRTITADYSGFRPKLFLNDKLYDDFKIVNECSETEYEVFHFLGIESPGLTACLSLAKEIRRRYGEPIAS